MYRMTTSNLIAVLLFVVSVNCDSCLTPNNELAECLPLFSCPMLMRAIEMQNNTSIIDFIKQSRCGSSDTVDMVCCGSTSNFTHNDEVPLTCGFQSGIDSYRAGNEATIGEFPWLALLISEPDEDLSKEFVEKSSKFRRIGCGASLINARYVLTAAHCLKTLLATVVGVRLGEQDMEQDNDCVKLPNYEQCSNPVEDLAIEEKIVHPHYDRKRGLNDIALLRLNKTVSFSDYIRPICLSTATTNSAKPGDVLLMSGFGRTGNSRHFSTIKKRVKVEPITNEICAQIYSFSVTRNESITDNVFCTVDSKSNTVYTCEGDSGAPVMLYHNNQFYLEGMVSWAANTCGDYPHVHTKVRNYLPWIEENIKSW